jgi:hypothetical protein
MKKILWIFAAVLIAGIVAADPHVALQALRYDGTNHLATVTNRYETIGITFATNDCAVMTDGTNSWWVSSIWDQQGASQSFVDVTVTSVNDSVRFKMVFTNFPAIADTLQSWGLSSE